MISLSPYLLIIQAVNFLISLAILNWLIIRPIRAVMAKRRAQNDGLRNEAGKANSAAAQKLESYEARLMQARVAMAAEREEAKKAAAEAAQVRLEAAGSDARNIRVEASNTLKDEGSVAEHALTARVDEFAQMALGRMLGV